MGMLAAMCLVNGGAAFSVFGHTVYNFLCGQDAATLHPKVEEVADTACKDFLSNVSVAFMDEYSYI